MYAYPYVDRSSHRDPDNRKDERSFRSSFLLSRAVFEYIRPHNSQFDFSGVRFQYTINFFFMFIKRVIALL